MIRYALIILIILIIIPARGQYQVTGTIIDESERPVPYATIAFDLIALGQGTEGAFSDEAGKFKMHLQPGTYTITVRTLGFKPLVLDSTTIDRSIDLGTWTLEADAIALKEIVIRGERTYVQNDLGKKTLFIGEDLANSGANAIDALESLPSVTTNVEGEVSVRGSQNVIIYVNGRETRRDPKTLRFVAADALQKIELITNPSAKYDAEGVAGIINLVYSKKKSTKLEGFGTLSAPYRASGGINAGISTAKFSYHLNLSGRDSKYKFRNEQLREAPEDNLRYYRTTIQGGGDGATRNLSTGITFEPDSTASVSVEANYLRWDDRDQENQQSLFLYPNDSLSLDLTNSKKEIEDEISFTISAEKDFANDHSLQLQITGGGENEINESRFNRRNLDVTDTPIGIGVQNSIESESQRYLQVKADYRHEINETFSLEGGVVSDYYNFNVNQTLDFYSADTQIRNFFDIEVEKYGSYVLAENSFANLEYQIGLRHEYFISNTVDEFTDSTFRQTFNNLFPSFVIRHELGNPTQTIGLSLSRRIKRPTFWEMSPFFSYVDPLNLRRGNPFLQPEIANQLELNYANTIGDFTIDLTAFRRITRQVIQRFSSQLSDEQVLVSYENLGVRNDDGLEWGLTYDLTNAVSLETSGSGYRTVYKESDEMVFYQRRWNWQWRSRARFKFKHGLIADIFHRFRGRTYGVQSVGISQSHLGLSIQQPFNRERGSITLAIRDITDARVFGSNLQTEEFQLHSRYKWQTRVASLTIRYKFIE